MKDHFVILNIETEDWVKDLDNDVIVFESKDLADAYIKNNNIHGISAHAISGWNENKYN